MKILKRSRKRHFDIARKFPTTAPSAEAKAEYRYESRGGR